MDLAGSVRAQIEHYFSLQNLKDDSFLVSQMNAQFYVPLRTVAEFARVKALTTSLQLIRTALRSSTAVAMDASETMVRPNVHEERNTIILREVSSATATEAVWGIFKVDGCPTPKTVRSDIGDIWFVEMGSEAEAKTAMKLLRDGEFQGSRLRMRLKSGNALRAIVAGLSSAPQPAADLSFVHTSTPPRQGAVPSPALSAASSPSNVVQSGGALPGPVAGAVSMAASTSGAMSTGHSSSVPSYAFGPGAVPGSGGHMLGMPLGGGPGTSGMGAAHMAAAMAMHGAPPGVAAAMASGDLVGPMAAAAFTPAVPTHFPAVTYTADQILTIAQGLSSSGVDVALPAGILEEEEFGCVFSRRPNPELLHRQRTQSVEASLASGRPRFDSVASVDVTSMHYGDSERGRRKASAAEARGVDVFGSYADDSAGGSSGGGAAPSSEELASMLGGALAGKGEGAARPAGKGRRRGGGGGSGGAPAASGGARQPGRGGRAGGGAAPAAAPGPASGGDGATGRSGGGGSSGSSRRKPANHLARRGRAAEGSASAGASAKEGAKPRAPAPYAAALLKAAPATVPKAISVLGHEGPRAGATTSTASGGPAPAPAEGEVTTGDAAARRAAPCATAAVTAVSPSPGVKAGAASVPPKPRAWGAGSSIVAVLQQKPSEPRTGANGGGMAHISFK